MKNIVFLFILLFSQIAIGQDNSNQIIESQGFNLNSLFRGGLGMLVLLGISILLSTNRKAINWRTVGFGLSAQLILAIAVLKIDFVQKIFKGIGGLFLAVLDFTQKGTEFLFAAFSTGKIDTSLNTFAISILPTIIFFSALTSLLFYLGIIQKVVKIFAWCLTKLLQVSGAESLSVAGNIFLGQTEAPLMIKAYLEKMNRSEILLVMIGGMVGEVRLVHHTPIVVDQIGEVVDDHVGAASVCVRKARKLLTDAHIHLAPPTAVVVVTGTGLFQYVLYEVQIWCEAVSANGAIRPTEDRAVWHARASLTID